MSPALLLGLILALPGLIPALQLSANVSSEVNREAARIYVFERLPHHLAPLEEPAAYIVMRLRRFAVPLLGFLVLWQWLQNSPTANESSTAANRVALRRLCRFAAITFLISVAGLLWELACKSNPLLAAALLRYYLFRMADVGVPLAASLLGCFWLELKLRQQDKLAPWALVTALLLVTWHLGGMTWERWKLPIPPADKKISGVTGWQEACDWVRANTPQDAMLLVPRNSQSLSWRAERKSLVTWKDVPQDAASLLPWFEKYQDVFLYEDEWGEIVPYGSLAEQGTERIQKLASKYEIDYLITREYPPLDLPQVFSNAWYIIYDVTPSDQKDSQ